MRGLVSSVRLLTENVMVLVLDRLLIDLRSGAVFCIYFFKKNPSKLKYFHASTLKEGGVDLKKGEE